MFCGCSKVKKTRRGRPDLSTGSDFSLLSDIPECSGPELSEEWCQRFRQPNVRAQGYQRNPESQIYEELGDVASPLVRGGGHFAQGQGYCAQRGGHFAQSGGHQMHCSGYQGMYEGRQQNNKCTPHVNQGFDSGIDTGSSPDSGHSLSRGARTVTILEQYGSAPLLEVCEHGSLSSLSGRPTKMLQSYRGQVKLSVYLNSGLLTLHVRQAKHLSSKWSTLPCPYVKVALIPDELNTSRCRSQSQTDTDHPRFDEKFSFEIGDEDFDKRLLVSFHSKDPNHNRSELLGCMSFGINSIVRRKTHVHGWYYLLSEQVGCRKHLQAHSKRHLVVAADTRSCILSETASCSEFSEGPQHDIPAQSAVLYMVRGQNGYGFTLSGGCPSTVLTVEPGSPADEEGMRVGDSVLSINYQDVSRSTADTVARIVRFHPEIEIEVQSPCAPTPSCWQDPDFLSRTSPLEDPPVKHSHVGSSTPAPGQSQRRIHTQVIPSQPEPRIHDEVNPGQSQRRIHTQPTVNSQSQRAVRGQAMDSQLQNRIHEARGLNGQLEYTPANSQSQRVVRGQAMDSQLQSRIHEARRLNGQLEYPPVNNQSQPRMQLEYNQSDSILHEAMIHQSPPQSYPFPDTHQLQRIIEEYS